MSFSRFPKVFFFTTMVFAVVVVFSAHAAWQGPTQAPPEGNVSAPLNVGTAPQTKQGELTVTNLTATSNVNVKTVSGNAEIDIQSASSPHWGIYQDDTTDELRFWNTNNRVVFTTSGSVGIGTSAAPTHALEVASTSNALRVGNANSWFKVTTGGNSRISLGDGAAHEAGFISGGHNAAGENTITIAGCSDSGSCPAYTTFHQSGNVGIGSQATSPSDLLLVAKDDAGGVGIKIANTDTGENATRSLVLWGGTDIYAGLYARSAAMPRELSRALQIVANQGAGSKIAFTVAGANRAILDDTAKLSVLGGASTVTTGKLCFSTDGTTTQCMTSVPAGATGDSSGGLTQTTADVRYVNVSGSEAIAGPLAIGIGAVASREHSIAIGNIANASNAYAIAIGRNARASGDYSIALGTTVVASGQTSTAFGFSATASGQTSTAFGQGTIASGQFSTAFGQGTIANQVNSTAFGQNTTASGYRSTAFGNNTIASGATSTAFGELATASGGYSTAIGQWVTAGTAQNTIVIGKGESMTSRLVNNTQDSFMIGFNSATPSLVVTGTDVYAGPISDANKVCRKDGTNCRAEDDPQVGVLTANKWCRSTDGATVICDQDAPSDGGLTQTTADGRYVNVSGDTMTGALSVGTSGAGSDVNFYGNIAGARMFWDASKQALRAGRVTGAQWNDANVGLYSFAAGFNSTASGTSSIASGSSSVASGTSSLATGIAATASGWGSLAIGGYTTASEQYSTALGTSTTASGYASFVSGSLSTASGNFSTAIGQWVTAGTAQNTIVIGKGESITSRLVNNTQDSFMVGFNSTTPSLVVTGTDVYAGPIDENNKVCRKDGTNCTVKFPTGTTDPVACNASNAGLAYFNTTDKAIKVCDGTAWIIPA